MRNKQRYCWQLQNHVWIQNFRRSNWKITMLGKSAYFFVVLWHGRSCQEIGGTILWVGEQDNSTTLQSINSMPWRPSFQRRRIEIRWRSVQKYALKLFWNTYTWHMLDDTIFYGQWTNLHDQSQNGPRQATNNYHLVWSLTFITQVNTHNIVIWETMQNHAVWDSDFAGDLEDSKCTSGGTLCIFGSHTFVPISWICEKQTSVSHSSTEWEIISLDAGLGMYGTPTLDLWDLIVTVLHGNTRRMIKYGETRKNLQRERKFMERLIFYTMLFLFPWTWILLVRKFCCTSLKTAKQWSRWS